MPSSTIYGILIRESEGYDAEDTEREREREREGGGGKGGREL